MKEKQQVRIGSRKSRMLGGSNMVSPELKNVLKTLQRGNAKEKKRKKPRGRSVKEFKR